MAYPFPEEALPTFQQFKELPAEEIEASCLKPTQYVVRIDRMEWLAAGNKPEGDDIPHCVTWQGVTYLYDGHHRWLLARLQGVTWMAVRNFVVRGRIMICDICGKESFGDMECDARTCKECACRIPTGCKVNPAWVAAGPEADAHFCFHPGAVKKTPSI